MSRIAKMPIFIPDGTSVSHKDGVLTIKGPRGSLSQHISESAVTLHVSDKEIKVKAANNETFSKAMSGTTRSLLSNMVKGVNDGFEKKVLRKQNRFQN